MKIAASADAGSAGGTVRTIACATRRARVRGANQEGSSRPILYYRRTFGIAEASKKPPRS